MAVLAFLQCLVQRRDLRVLVGVLAAEINAATERIPLPNELGLG